MAAGAERPPGVRAVEPSGHVVTKRGGAVRLLRACAHQAGADVPQHRWIDAMQIRITPAHFTTLVFFRIAQ
jgi:hypothetical protein